MNGRNPDDGLPQIIEKGESCRHDFRSDEELYARAIYLGQGCWESLSTISEEEAQRILRECSGGSSL